MPPVTPARRPRPAPVLSDHVRARLDVLLAEAPPRRALPPNDPDATVVRSVAAQAATDVIAPPAAVPASGRFTRRHLMVVAAMLALGVLVALYALSRAKAVPLHPVAVEPVATVAVDAAPAASPAPSPTPRLRVHVIGAVRHPGVVSLSAGGRVQDAVAAAGGLTEQARPGDLNLAAPVADGQQIVVGDVRRPGGQVRGGEPKTPPPGGTPAPSSGATGGSKLNLNSATEAQLDALPGVGPVTAQKIVAWRKEHQRFSKVAELQEVPGIGPKTFTELEPLVTV